MGDFYGNYEELRLREREGEDYQIAIVTEGRDPRIVVMAPHGGKIERGTSEIAGRIAAAEYALYKFEGKRTTDNGRLHITSHRFDEPQALELAKAAVAVLCIHGMTGDDEFVMVGGLHQGLVLAAKESLNRLGIKTPASLGHLAATDQRNICNRSQRRGVQLEISRSLRDSLLNDEQRLARLADEMANLLREELRNTARIQVRDV